MYFSWEGWWGRAGAKWLLSTGTFLSLMSSSIQEWLRTRCSLLLGLSWELGCNSVLKTYDRFFEKGWIVNLAAVCSYWFGKLAFMLVEGMACMRSTLPVRRWGWCGLLFPICLCVLYEEGPFENQFHRYMLFPHLCCEPILKARYLFCLLFPKGLFGIDSLFVPVPHQGLLVVPIAYLFHVAHSNNKFNCQPKSSLF